MDCKSFGCRDVVGESPPNVFDYGLIGVVSPAPTEYPAICVGGQRV